MKDSTKLITGLFLIVAGVLMLLDKLGLTFIEWKTLFFFVSLYWPLAVIAIGIVQLVVYQRYYLGMVLVAIGATLEISKFTDFGAWELLFPLLVIIVGISLVGKKAIKRQPTEEKSQDQG